MLSLVLSSLVLFNFFIFSFAGSNCPLYGPTFPTPQQPSTSTSVQAAIQNLTSTFSEIDTYYGANNSYSIQVFSSSGILFEHYHTAPSLPSLNSSGVKQVDAHTVYRIGSLTKIFTMYASLLEAGYQYFSHPITDFVPELAALATWWPGNAITNVAWGDVTIGDLASHLAGIASDCKYTQSDLRMI
jgi:CubicO group peptidase (beta-lactamase class C family)